MTVQCSAPYYMYMYSVLAPYSVWQLPTKVCKNIIYKPNCLVTRYIEVHTRNKLASLWGNEIWNKMKKLYEVK